MRKISKAIVVLGLLLSDGVGGPRRASAQDGAPAPAPGPQNLRLAAYTAKNPNSPGVTVTSVVRGKPASRILVRRIVNGQSIDRQESLIRGDVILFPDGTPIDHHSNHNASVKSFRIVIQCVAMVTAAILIGLAMAAAVTSARARQRFARTTRHVDETSLTARDFKMLELT
jgi:S1-C subfamily serine protease